MLSLEEKNLKFKVQDYLQDIYAPFIPSEDPESIVAGDIQIGDNFYQLSIEKDSSGVYLTMSTILPIESMADNDSAFFDVLKAVNDAADRYIATKFLTIREYGVLIYSVIDRDIEGGFEDRLVSLSKVMEEAYKDLEERISSL